MIRPFLGNSSRARILRAFVPVLTLAIVLNGIIHDLLFRHVEPSKVGLFNAIATILGVVLSTIALIRISKPMGLGFDAKENALAAAEDEVRRSERTFLSFMEHGPFTAFIRDGEGRYKYSNPFFGRMYNSTHEGILNKTSLEIGFPEALATEVMADDQRVLNSGIPSERIVEMRHFDGCMRQWFAVKFPLVDATGAKLIGGVALDLSARVQAEEAKLEAQELLLGSYKQAALGRMAGNIAHEINNPLSIIDGKSRQLCEILETQPIDAELAIRFGQAISEMALRLVKIVNGLRTMSRETARDPFTRKSVAELVEEAIALCAPKFKIAGVSLTAVEIPASLEIECRPSEIEQVLLNLFGNALDAIESLPEKWVRVEVREDEKFVKIAIIDSGSGIPAEIRDKILEPFFTTKEVGKGTGLGLSISSQLIHGHGGMLSIDASSPHTSFVVNLPKKANG